MQNVFNVYFNLNEFIAVKYNCTDIHIYTSIQHHPLTTELASYLLLVLISIRFAQNVHIDIVMDKMFEALYIKYNHEAPIHSLKIVILARLNVKMYFPFLYRILQQWI